MIKNRKDTIPILIDLHYIHSMNTFEEFYGDSISYSEIEQSSYIDLKDMVFEMIGRSVKFRKFGRLKNILTIKVDITCSEYESFLKIFREEELDLEATNNKEKNPTGKLKYIRFNFFHDFKISNIRDLTDEERIKFKKVVEDEEQN